MVVKEVWQLLVSDGCAAFGAVDTVFGAWHGGHSLCGLSSAFGAVDTAFWSIVQVGIFLEVRISIKPYNSATFMHFDSLMLQMSKT